MSILVVDDSTHQKTLLKRHLEKAGFFDTVFVASAEEAFVFLGMNDNRHKTDVDLILMDIVMPGMNGIEACRQIKSDICLSNIPIIMVTGMTDEENLGLAFEAGAQDYLIKPVNRIDLVARVRSLLKLKQETDLRKAREEELKENVKQLQKALANVKQLKRLLPICAHCKKIRDDAGYWQQVEIYFQEHSDVDFSHGICPECLKEHYPEYADRVLEKIKKEAPNHKN